MPPDADVRVHVQPITPTLAASVRALRVAPGQHDYVGDPAFNLDDAQRDPRSEAMAILAGDDVIGFYRLDLAANAVASVMPLYAGPNSRSNCRPAASTASA